MTNTMWTLYAVEWRFLTSLCGSVPANPDLFDAWFKSRQPTVRPPGARSVVEIQEEVLNTLAAPEPTAEETIQESLLVFQRVNGHLAMRAATIKAHFKDCARVLSTQYIGQLEREAAFSTRITNCVCPDLDYWIPILNGDGKPLTGAHGIREKPVHVRGPRGPVNALKAIEYVENASMRFRLRVLGAGGSRTVDAPPPDAPPDGKLAKKPPKTGRHRPSVSLDDLATLMTYGGVHGYAGERGDGEGRYEFSIQEVTP